MSQSKYILTLTTDQLLTVAKACEFYSRVMMGQFGEIAYETMLPSISQDDYCARREMMEDLLFQARKLAFPDLIGRGHSYGIGHNLSADRAWNAYQALRHARTWHEHPEGGITVDFHPPYPAGGEGIPDCKVLAPENDAAEWKKKHEAFSRYLADVHRNLRKANECGGCSADLVEQIIKALDEQPTVEYPIYKGWIDANKNPPENWQRADGTYTDFLVFTPRHGIAIGNYAKPVNIWLCFGLRCEVTHWMPLMEPPKGGKK